MAADGDMSEESAKSKKYDRQLRLWDDHGQQALEAAHVCLVNATATGTEVLKSLILPGVGAFTILDGETVSGEDAGNNFFLDKESIGKSRAKVATDYLCELNSDVRGEFVDETPECIMQVEPNFFDKFSVVIVTNVSEKLLLDLAEKLWIQGIPLLVCRAYGMIGYMRLQVAECTIIESHPDSELQDLRLDNPFSSLQEYESSIDLKSMSDQQQSLVPFVIILLKYLNLWKTMNGGKIPKNSKEKSLFKEEIMKHALKSNEQDEKENFLEACRAVNRSIVETSTPSDILKIFKDPSCTNLTSESKPFWILARALKEFVENEGKGCLPVRGTIPDMTSDTHNYIKLQNIYKAQSISDAETIYNRAKRILLSLGKPENTISLSDAKLFCKNAHCLKVVRGRSLREEYDPASANVQSMVANLENEDSDIIFYILIRAVDRFSSEFRRFPGRSNEQVELDILKLKNCTSSLLQEWGCGPILRDDYIHEMCRFGAAELHSVAAFMGGCAAQEIIKLLTGQYVPFNNTVIYYALNQTISTFYF